MRMSACVEITSLIFFVVRVEPVLVVPAARRENCPVSVQPPSGVGEIGANAVDSR